MINLKSIFISLLAPVVGFFVFQGVKPSITNSSMSYAYVDGNDDHGTHSEWVELTSTNTYLTGGETSDTMVSYYLSDDLTLTEQDITVTSGYVAICLNGHTLTGTGNDSVITVSSGAYLTLCDCSTTPGIITGGQASSTDSIMYGGGIKVYGSLTMYGGEISGNVMNNAEEYGSYSAYGGGVYVNGGTFTMYDGTIKDNVANRGGGLTITNGTFEFYGGEITNNYSYRHGGGIYTTGTTNITINGEDALIANNDATYSGGGGGGICAENGTTITLNSGEISSNTAGYGASIYLTTGVTFNMTGGYLDGDIRNNNSGGTISISEGYLSASAYEVGQNYIASGYVASSNQDDTYIYVVEEDDFVFDVNDYNTHDGSHEGWSTITSNGGTFGGTNGMEYYYLNEDIELTSDITISSRYVTICLNGHSLTGSGNSSIITVNGTATLFLFDCNGDHGEHTYYVDSLGLYHIYEGSPPSEAPSNAETGTISGGIITGATRLGSSNTFGSGAYVYGTLYMYGGTIVGNSATQGAGIYVPSGGTLEMNGGAITGNYGTSGVGVYVNSGNFILNDGTISYNTGTGTGGAIRTWYSTNFVMNGGLIEGNYNTSGGGIVLYCDSFEMNGGTITNNSSPNANAIYMQGASGYTVDCIINGGYINGSLGKNSTSYTINVTINGGYFSSSGYSSASTFVASDRMFVEINDETGDTDYLSPYNYAVYGYQTVEPFSVSGGSSVYGEDLALVITELENIYGFTYSIRVRGITYTNIADLPRDTGTYSVTVNFDSVVDGANKLVYYADSITTTYTVTACSIENVIDRLEIGSIDSQEYTGEQITPTVSVSIDGVTLNEGSDYTLTYGENITNEGSVTVEFIGNYSGSVTVNFEILNSPSGLGALGISLIVIGCVIVVAALAGLLIFFLRKKKKTKISVE